MTKKQLIQKLAKTKKASVVLGLSSVRQRNKALQEMARILHQNQRSVLIANQKDVKKIGSDSPMQDRLLLTRERIASVIKNIKTIIKLPDPVNKICVQKKLTNGLNIKKITVPFGVIAVIYESRPNVTVDVVSLCLKSGNAIVLKGGTDAWHSNQVLIRLMQKAVKAAGLSEHLILNINPQDRGLIKHLLSAKDYIDLIIPRGGQSLINYVQENSKIPVIETGAGVCHTFVDESADIKMAVDIIYNAKTSRPSVCNALDTLIVHKQVASKLLKALSQKLAKSHVEVFADADSYKVLKQLKYPYLQKAKKTDFGKEFLSLRMAVKTVKNIDKAIHHINRYSTQHSEAIITENQQNAQKFLRQVDVACVYHNASTRFTDGSQFGLGGEIGISTQKLHVRGPMSIGELTSYRWVIKGKGQVRE